MLIAEFAGRTGLTRDTIRFYVRKNLFQPDVGSSGTNRYQRFGDEDLEMATMIRFGQQLGFTLREIVALKNEFGESDVPIPRQRQLMAERLAAVEIQLLGIIRLRAYFKQKIAWLDAGAAGKPPEFFVPTE